MEGSLKELAVYRMERAKEMLVASEENLKMLDFSFSVFESSHERNEKELRTNYLVRQLLFVFRFPAW